MKNEVKKKMMMKLREVVVPKSREQNINGKSQLFFSKCICAISNFCLVHSRC